MSKRLCGKVWISDREYYYACLPLLCFLLSKRKITSEKPIIMLPRSLPVEIALMSSNLDTCVQTMFTGGAGLELLLGIGGFFFVFRSYFNKFFMKHALFFFFLLTHCHPVSRLPQAKFTSLSNYQNVSFPPANWSTCSSLSRTIVEWA